MSYDYLTYWDGTMKEMQIPNVGAAPTFVE